MERTTVGLIVILTLCLLLVPCAADAQQPTKVHRIGWLDARGPGPSLELDAFRQRLRDLGYRVQLEEVAA